MVGSFGSDPYALVMKISVTSWLVEACMCSRKKFLEKEQKSHGPKNWAKIIIVGVRGLLGRSQGRNEPKKKFQENRWIWSCSSGFPAHSLSLGTSSRTGPD